MYVYFLTLTNCSAVKISYLNKREKTAHKALKIYKFCHFVHLRALFFDIGSCPQQDKPTQYIGDGGRRIHSPGFNSKQRK
jgi:hypothetical protein